MSRLLWSLAACLSLTAYLSAAPLTLSETFAEGTRYRIRTRVELTGTLTPPAAKGKTSKAVKIDGNSAIDYAERVIAVESGRVSKTLRICAKLDFRRTLAGQKQELALRPAVKRLVVIRKGHTEVPFSPDGPLMWGEIDAVRTDVFVPALTGLLPGKAVEVGDKWKADASAVQELTDLEKIDEGGLDCTFAQTQNVGGVAVAVVSFTGTVRGVGEDGPVRHRLQGTYRFDTSAGYMSQLTLLGTTTMVDADGKETGRIEGRFVMTREPTTADGLADADVRGLDTEPNADNTRMLYDNPELGVKFLHTRRWKIAQVMGTQVALSTSDGSGVLVTVDPPEKVPTAAAYQTEARGWLTEQKAKIVASYSPRRLRDTPTLDGFAFEAVLGSHRVWLDYYVTKQATGGAVVAGRLVMDDLKELRKDVDRIARSVVVTRRK